MPDENEIERIWDGLLSRKPARIRKSFRSLDADSQREVLQHLNRMASEEGWHPEQVLSAQAALKALAG